jgi:hypothetical protein
MRALLFMLLALALQPHYHASIDPLPASVRADVKAHAWDPGCPLPLSRLRVLTVAHWGFDRRVHSGRLVVNARVAAPLAKVFRRLYELRFPIRHLRLADAYGPEQSVPRDGDVSGSFECKQAIPSPCDGGTGTGSWSEHAYGEAVDLNPVENPYTGCGRAHTRASRKYMDRSRLRRGMVTPEVVRAFRSIGWGWGGSWPGSTKDYTHFSVSGH